MQGKTSKKKVDKPLEPGLNCQTVAALQGEVRRQRDNTADIRTIPPMPFGSSEELLKQAATYMRAYEMRVGK